MHKEELDSIGSSCHQTRNAAMALHSLHEGRIDGIYWLGVNGDRQLALAHIARNGLKPERQCLAFTLHPEDQARMAAQEQPPLHQPDAPQTRGQSPISAL